MIDVRCGRDFFPTSRLQSRQLAAQRAVLVGVDPDDTLGENPYVHERVNRRSTPSRVNREFDFVTLRMVAEHIGDPVSAVAFLAHVT